MFKIVVFLKNRGKTTATYYAYVPEAWEVNGHVYWPEKNLEKLRKDPNSKPNIQEWTKFKAVVKMQNIQSHEDAILYEDNFVQMDSTDSE